MRVTELSQCETSPSLHDCLNLDRIRTQLFGGLESGGEKVLADLK